MGRWKRIKYKDQTDVVSGTMLIIGFLLILAVAFRTLEYRDAQAKERAYMEQIYDENQIAEPGAALGAER